MTDCERLSDRMPDVARGRGAWSHEDHEHLTWCPACRAEWDLVRLAATHGMVATAAVSGTRVADAVLARLGREPVVAPVRRISPLRRVAWPAAVAAGLVLGVWLGPRMVPAGERVASGMVAFLHELDDLDDAELETMLAGVEDPAAVFRPLDTPESLSDLTESELELLLSSMEG